MFPKHLSVALAAIFSLLLSGCTGLFSTVFGQDDPKLFVEARPLYRLPFPVGNARYLLVQGVGGRFSHTDSDAWAFDWAMPKGTPILAARDGVVIAFRNDANDKDRPLEQRRANFVRIRHSDATTAVYAHLDSTSVARGQSFSAGDTIGVSGNSGFSTQPHLHFHVEHGGRTIPISFHGYGIPRVGVFYP